MPPSPYGVLAHEPSFPLAHKVERYIPELADDDRRRDVCERVTAFLGAHEPMDQSSLALSDLDVEPHPRFASYFAALAEVWTSEDLRELDLALASGGTSTMRDVVTGRDAPAGESAGRGVRDDALDAATTIVSNHLLRTVLQALEERRRAGHLVGEDAESRFADFHSWLVSEAGSVHMTTTYGPAYLLARERARRAVRNVREIVDRVHEDLPQLSRTFEGISEDAGVSRIGVGEGDSHADGRSVAIVTFDDGARIVVKPRDVRSDVSFNALVDWTNRVGLTRLPVLRALPRDGYGYVEFVESLDTSEAEQSEQAAESHYFDQVGQLTALLYVLRATDIHFENVLATRHGPVVVDTETLLTPEPRTRPSYDDGAASTAARRAVLQSVLGIGILPTLVTVPSREGSIDIGAMGYQDGQTAPIKSLVVVNEGRDDMHTSLTFASLGGRRAPRPVGGEALPPSDQRDRIGGAFARVLLGLVDHRDGALSVIREVFGGCVQRFVPSPTLFYSQLLRMATHPSVLTDPEARAVVLNRVCLREGVTAVSLADGEFRQLWAGDVPYFTYIAESTSIFSRDPGADERWSEYPDFFVCSGLDAVVRRLESLDTVAIARQRELIDFAFVNKLDAGEDRTPISLRPCSGSSDGRAGDGTPVHERTLAAVRMLLDPVVESIVDGEDPGHPATWIGPVVTTADHAQWQPGTLGYDLYGGSAGIALVLAGAGALMGEPSYGAAAGRVLGPIASQLTEERIDAGMISAGGFTGMGGTVYAIVRAAALQGSVDALDVPALLSALARAGRSEPDGHADITVGAVGALAAGLAARSLAPRRDVDACDSALEQLAQQATDAVRRLDPTTAYTGYAHGLAGIAPILLRAGSVLDDGAMTSLGLEVFRVLDRARVVSEDDWPRTVGDADGRRSYAWCHGAPGLLLAYAEVDELAPGAVPGGRVERLVELTLRRGLGNNPTLCHGDAGTLDVLLEAGSRGVDRPCTEPATRALHERLVTAVLDGPADRSSRYAFTTSLMVGSAGTAWSLLRGIAPHRFPSILRLG